MTKRTSLAMAIVLALAWPGSAAAEGAAGWSSVPAPVPATDQGTLAAVSCGQAGVCLAVGEWAATDSTVRALAMTWVGNRWTVADPVRPAGAPSVELAGVTCLSSGRCLAVGDYAGSGGARRALAEEWDGQGWSVQQVPDLPGESDSLVSVSCGGPTSCTAVGSATATDGTVRPLAENWDGTTWSAATPAAPPGAATAGLTGVSCATPTACTAVGTAASAAFAEHWDGTSWTVDLAAAPPGADMSGLTAITCAAATSCLAVGNSASKRSGVAGATALAERWDGTGWTDLRAANPTDAFYGSTLSGIACPAASTCVAVGSYGPADHSHRTLAEGWDGTSWTVQPTPSPDSTANAALTGVSCPSAGGCIAAGSTARTTGVPVTLADQWDGQAWRTTLTPDRSGSQVAELHGASCPAATACMAVGTTRSAERAPGPYSASAGEQDALSEWFDGSGWRLEPVPPPPGGSGVVLDGVSCPGTDMCLAVGSYDTGHGMRVPLAQRWDGQHWIPEFPADPAGSLLAAFTGVSCQSSSSCTAVGSKTGGDGTTTLAERWDGGAWSIQATPNAPASSDDVLRRVSCPALDSCVAVGSYLAAAQTGFGTRSYALAEHWDGAAWVIDPAAPPAASPSSLSAGFSSVSCPAAADCWAVGSFSTFDRPYPNPALAEHWDGHAWTTVAIPNPPGLYDALENLSGVSCSSGSDCEAVGFSYGGTGADSGIHPIGEHWDGAAWSLDPLAEPAGARLTEPADVSCHPGCTAVGQFTYDDQPVAATGWPAFPLIEVRS